MKGRKRGGFTSKLPDGLSLSQIEMRARLGDAADTPGGDAVLGLGALCGILVDFKKPCDVRTLVATQPSAVEHLQRILEAATNNDWEFFADAAEVLRTVSDGSTYARSWSQVAAYVGFRRWREPNWRPTMKELQEQCPDAPVKAIRKIVRSAGITVANPKGGRPKK